MLFFFLSRVYLFICYIRKMFIVVIFKNIDKKIGRINLLKRFLILLGRFIIFVNIWIFRFFFMLCKLFSN